MRRAAISVAFLGLVLLAGAAGLVWINGISWKTDDTFFLPIQLASAVSAGILAAKAPKHRITWIVVIAWFSLGLLAFSSSYNKAYESSGPEAFVRLMEWASSVSFFLWLVCIGVILPALFPTGRALGRKWRPIPWIAVTALAVLSAIWLAFAFSADLEAVLTGTVEFEGGFLNAQMPLAIAMIVFAMIGALVSLLVRYRRSRRIERKQLQWFFYAAGIMLVGAVGEFVNQDGLVSWLMSIGAAALMVSIVIAITRYRLYDIDRLVNRTVVYAFVVAALAAVFAAGVIVLTEFLPFEDNLAVAASTLAVFFLFQPLRRRVQRFVDRRFNRGKYDPEEVSADLSARLRDQVEPQRVTAEWANTVVETMQPASLAVWVKES